MAIVNQRRSKTRADRESRIQPKRKSRHLHRAALTYLGQRMSDRTRDSCGFVPRQQPVVEHWFARQMDVQFEKIAFDL